MQAQKEKFVKAASTRAEAEKARSCSALEPFAGYAFNKSHSAAYAYLAYVTGYLKVHYTVEFMSAVLTRKRVSQHR